MKKSLLFVALILPFFVSSAVAQGTSDYEYKREFIWGATKATNSGLIGGVVVKFGLAVGEKQFQTFSLELVNIKHPQEQREPSYQNTGTYIWGKTNYLFSIRPQYGREWVFFKKAAQQGVQISGIVAGGPSLGLEAPYYINYGDINNFQRVPYDPSIHRADRIQGASNVFQSLGSAKLVPGFNVKSSLAFEFGTFKSNVMGIETGFMFEGFSREINMLSNHNNQQFFPNAFITLYYGTRR